MSAARRAELAERLAAVRRRIADACAAAGRGADEVELMAVTKTVSAADVAALLDLGLDLLGENRVQEATRKVDAVAALRPDAPDPGGISSADCSGTRHGPSCAGPNRWNRWTPCALADALAVAVRRSVDTGGRESSLSVLHPIQCGR